jgi:CheY-like chemotaxis protein
VHPCICSTRPLILAVDDNIFNIVALQTVLEFELKLSSDQALNGLEALTRVQERDASIAQDQCTCGNPDGNSNYRVIFMDCNMPIMDGF